MRSRITRLIVTGLAAGAFALVAACEVENGEPIEEEDPFAPTEETDDGFEDDGGLEDDGLEDDTDDDV